MRTHTVHVPIPRPGPVAPTLIPVQLPIEGLPPPVCPFICPAYLWTCTPDPHPLKASMRAAPQGPAQTQEATSIVLLPRSPKPHLSNLAGLDEVPVFGGRKKKKRNSLDFQPLPAVPVQGAGPRGSLHSPSPTARHTPEACLALGPLSSFEAVPSESFSSRILLSFEGSSAWSSSSLQPCGWTM